MCTGICSCFLLFHYGDIMYCIINCKTYTRHLPHYHRGKQGFRAVGATFSRSKHMAHLDLSRNNNAGCEGVVSFCDAAIEIFGKCGIAFPALEQLNLTECNIGPVGMQALSDVLLSGECQDGKKRQQRIHLVLRSNLIGADGCPALAALVSGTDGSILSNLQIGQCSIGDEGITTISNAAVSNPCTGLMVLDISDNAITKDGAKKLAESLLVSWPDLVELNLAKNNVGSEGVASVMASLLGSEGAIGNSKNSTLKNLDLTSTDCGVDGAKVALTSGGLTTLRLFNNHLGSDGFISIAPLLQGGHAAIEHLDLGGNSADEDAVVALLDSIANVKEGLVNKLAVLEIGGNTFGDKAAEALERLKRVWPKLDVAHDKPVREGEEEEEQD